MIEELKKNIDEQIEILREISMYNRRVEFSSEAEKKLLLEAIDSLKNSMKLINGAIPKILENLSSANKLPDTQIKQPKKEVLTSVVIKQDSGTEKRVTLKKEDKEKLMKELSIRREIIKNLRKRENENSEKYQEFKTSRGYLKLCNRFCLGLSKNLIRQGYFTNLKPEIKKANIEILFETYVSMILFTTILSSIASVFLLIGLAIMLGDFFALIKYLWLIVALPAAVFTTLYFYPATERSSIAKKIDQELPFAAIHMKAIAGSGITPSEIFRIIGTSKEYPNLKKEIRKILNQINIYGYDLVTSINNTARATPSQKLAELLGGLSTTISSGGDLPSFFEKRSETLLVSYRLEREKYIKLAETFMDIYISVVIAAPMILMLLFIMLSVSQIGASISQTEVTFFIIFGVAIINVLFIIFLHLKQPVY